MEATELRDWLKGHKLLTDGAMGTYYASLCREETAMAEWANITAPDIIRRIHREYLQAGAVLIKTNTFGVNRTLLEITAEKESELVHAACENAKAAASEELKAGRTLPVFLAADIGPLPMQGEAKEEELLQEYCYLCDLFLKEGLTIFWFETFSDAALIRQVAAYIKEKCREAFIAVSFSLNKNGYTLLGKRADRLLAELAESTVVDAAGFNCGIGPGHMKQLFKRLPFPAGLPVIAAPNAGYPEQADNRMAFLDNAAYFADNIKELAEAGADILGACCGTTPLYVREMAERLAAKTAKQAEVSVLQKPSFPEEKTIKLQGENRFFEKLQAGKKVIAVELDPPYDADITKVMDCGSRLLACGADILTFADSPMGRSRIDSVLMSIKLKQEFGVEVMPHICCRDKNVIAIRSMLLGAYIHDIRNLLIVTGDPIPGESRKTTTGVFDYNSIRLMQYVREMNAEHFAKAPFVFGGALNYAGNNVNAIVKRMQDKLEAGASYFLTQPIFAKEDMERVSYLKEKTGAHILCGIMPPVSYRNAVFVRNEIAGIRVPDEVVARYDADMSKEEAEEVGADLAKELMREMASFADGYYFMLPFNRVSLLEKVLAEQKPEVKE